ncbi:MAG TPA: alpha-L-arabinofuranosidase C-terminal domain-containing protein [Terriglobales bacterium]|nr:alpha-L-arabinofuranosidase C-terminal domain-containing protein [Terriglobales bacterium]
MRSAICRYACVLGLALSDVVFAQNQLAPETTTIQVDARKTSSYSLPRSIFGTFLEPIGNSTYNGLWAELLQNPSFEDSLWDVKHVAEMVRDNPELSRASEMALPLPWEPLRYAQGSRYAPQWNDAANSYRSLLLMALPDKDRDDKDKAKDKDDKDKDKDDKDKQTGIRQKVYLPVHRVSHYVGSIYLKLVSGPATVEVSLRERNHPDQILSSREIQIDAPGWKRYEFALDVSPHQIEPLESVDFVIAAGKETRVLIDQASLLPGDNIDGMDPEMIAMSRALKTPVVRFGGNFTSAYHWKDGTGPRDQRVSMLNTAWGIPEYNQFGTDEFLRFCQLIGAEPQIALNLGTGTPREAADWVQYVNAHWGDHSGGLLWELGNELWGDFQVGYPTLPRAAERTKAFSEAVRKVDSKARIIATGGDPDTFHDWNAAQLASPSDTFNYLSTHFVVTTNSVETPHASPDFIAKATFALPIELERRLQSMHQQFQDSPGRTVNTAFTEWLFWSSEDQFSPRYDNMGGAIGTAGLLNMLLRNSNIVPISDMTGIIEFGGIWKKRSRVFAVPAYWVFRMYSNADAARLVETHSTGEKYDVKQGSTRLPNIADVPYLDVVAALNRSGNTLTLFCVNRHLTRDLDTKINLTDFRPTRATAHSIWAGSIYEKNDETEPEHIHPRDSSLSVDSSEFNYTFRHESVTVIELGR